MTLLIGYWIIQIGLVALIYREFQNIPYENFGLMMPAFVVSLLLLVAGIEYPGLSTTNEEVQYEIVTDITSEDGFVRTIVTNDDDNIVKNFTDARLIDAKLKCSRTVHRNMFGVEVNGRMKYEIEVEELGE